MQFNSVGGHVGDFTTCLDNTPDNCDLQPVPEIKSDDGDVNDETMLVVEIVDGDGAQTNVADVVVVCVLLCLRYVMFMLSDPAHKDDTW